MNRKILTCLMISILSFAFVIMFSNNTYAINAASIGTITNRAKVADLKKCHQYFGEEIDAAKINRPSDILAGGTGNELALPNGVLSNDSLFSCKTLLDNYMGYSFNSGDIASKANFLKQMGYKNDTAFGRKCYNYRIREGGTDWGAGGAPEQIITVCANTQSGSTIVGIDIEGGKGNTPVSFGAPDMGNNRLLVNILGIDYYIDFDPNDPNSLFKGIDSTLTKLVNGTGYFYGVEYGGGMSENPDAEKNIYKKGPFISNTSTIFTEDERVGLLAYYFTKYGNISCEWKEGAVELTINSQTYYVSEKPEGPSTFYIINGTEWFGTAGWGEIVSALNGMDIGNMPTCDGVEPPASGGGTLPGSDATEIDADDKPCFNGAGALGWIVCPVIKFLRLTLETIYENIVVPFLQINAKTFSNENGGVVAGWQAFQGFANLAFVALLLIVIFSQVTGVGIDNLGIKRILPKLIIAAILINLSYIICQLLVDASNIAGYGLRSLFDSIQVGETNITGTGQTIMNTALTAAVTAMAGYGAAATAAIWAPFLILPFLLALVGMLISVLFMFILLGVRQAGVIILVVISPLAFAMYMLPNTKPLFQRWWKAFTGLLLLFPICGAMIGGADLAGKILASTSDEFWPNLIAALLTVVPFFFIPTLLKGSFSALGNLGAKISGVGAKIGARAGGIAKAGVERTGAFRNIQANAQERQDVRNRVAERKRLEGVTRRIGNIAESVRTPEQRVQYARAQAALEKMKDEEELNPDLIASEAVARRFNRQVEAVKSRNVASGAVNVTGDVKGFNGKGSSFASGSLAHILYNTQDEAERYATVSQLMASGHHGAEALHQVMEALGNDGNQAALSSIAKAAKGDNKLGDLKSGSRSTYDYINDLAAGQVQAGAVGSGNNISDYAGKVKFGGMSEQQLINTDKEELQRYAQVINQKRASGESLTSEEQKLVQQATAAWDNERLRGSAKKDVQNLVSEIAFGAVNIGNNKARPGTSFDVQHNNGNSKSAPAPRTSADRVNAATNRLEEIARQRNNGGGA
ncbi:hypothetical protein IKE88_02055 [Candidatus Saccharibacteria bacterium]|nr:hypothetical protein [Candidatus Saccharibacteria bacterium]